MPEELIESTGTEVEPSAAPVLESADEYLAAEKEFNSIFDEIIAKSAQPSQETPGDVSEQTGKAAAQPKPAAEKPPENPAAAAKEAAPAEPEPAEPPHRAQQGPSADQAREAMRRNIMLGMDHLNRMKRAFERQYGTSLYPPELLERERQLNEAELSLDAELPKVSSAVDARVNRIVNERVREAIEQVNANASRMTAEQAKNAQIAIVSMAHPDVNLEDPKFHDGFIAWARTLPYDEAAEILDIHARGNAAEVVMAIRKYKEAIGAAQPQAGISPNGSPAGSASGVKRGRTAAALAVPTNRTATPKATATPGDDPDDYDGAYEKARSKIANAS